MTPNKLARCKTLLGTFVEIDLTGHVDDSVLVNLSETLFDEIERIHDLMSFHDESSELSQFNKQALNLAPGETLTIELSNDLHQVLSFALELHKFTRGNYDIAIAPSLVISGQLPNHLSLNVDNSNESHNSKNVLNFGNSFNLLCNKRGITINKPLCIDLGGIAKGYAVDCALSKVPENIDCCINAGGDLAMSHWKNKRINLKYGKRNSALREVKMQNSALATTANYHRGDQSGIVKPLTGKQVRFKGSMSVFSSRAMISDALTKAMILSSKAQKRKIARYYNAQAIKINRLGFVKLYY